MIYIVFFQSTNEENLDVLVDCKNMLNISMLNILLQIHFNILIIV